MEGYIVRCLWISLTELLAMLQLGKGKHRLRFYGQVFLAGSQVALVLVALWTYKQSWVVWIVARGHFLFSLFWLLASFLLAFGTQAFLNWFLAPFHVWPFAFGIRLSAPPTRSWWQRSAISTLQCLPSPSWSCFPLFDSATSDSNLLRGVGHPCSHWKTPTLNGPEKWQIQLQIFETPTSEFPPGKATSIPKTAIVEATFTAANFWWTNHLEFGSFVDSLAFRVFTSTFYFQTLMDSGGSKHWKRTELS